MKTIYLQFFSGQVLKKTVAINDDKILKMKRLFIFFLFLPFLLSSCSNYHKLLKSTDSDLKYRKAMEFHANGDYLRASTLLGQLMRVTRGTDRSENVHFTYADCLFRMGDYLMAEQSFEMFVQNYPNSAHAEDAQYMIAYSNYRISPNPRLDQAHTYKAIEAFQLFISLYPRSDRVAEANKLMAELRDKLAYKAYLNARLYFDLGSYLGNNYQSAIITARNTIEAFPETRHREELSFLILDAKYILAVNSVEARMEERLRETIDEYHAFLNEFPTSEYIARANRIYQEVSALLN